MKRRRPGSGQTGTIQSHDMFEVPTHWSSAQATAIFELLDELMEPVWRSYGCQIQPELHRYRVVKTSAIPTSLGTKTCPSRTAIGCIRTLASGCYMASQVIPTQTTGCNFAMVRMRVIVQVLMFRAVNWRYLKRQH